MGAYAWSNPSVKEKVGLSVVEGGYTWGLISGEIRYHDDIAGILSVHEGVP